MMKKEEILINRIKYLNILRSGRYKKGTILSDSKGYPITDPFDQGYCACAIMVHEFPNENGKESISIGRKALGISNQACKYIQQQINDTNLTFPQMADRIESEVFKNKKFATYIN